METEDNLLRLLHCFVEEGHSPFGYCLWNLQDEKSTGGLCVDRACRHVAGSI